MVGHRKSDGQSRRKAKPRRGGRPRSGQAPLSRERILTEALRLVDEDGLQGLTMRRLAAELGVNPMSIYHHLRGKSAVVAGLVERVFSEMRLPDRPVASWRDRVHAWASAYRELVRVHPNLVLPLVADAAAVSRAALLVSEPLYAALRQAGLAPIDVVRSADTLVDFTHGFGIAETAQPAGQPFDRSSLSRGVEGGLPEAVPAMRSVFGALSSDEARYDFDTGFESGLSILIAGISQKATPDT